MAEGGVGNGVEQGGIEKEILTPMTAKGARRTTTSSAAAAGRPVSSYTSAPPESTWMFGVDGRKSKAVQKAVRSLGAKAIINPPHSALRRQLRRRRRPRHPCRYSAGFLREQGARALRCRRQPGCPPRLSRAGPAAPRRRRRVRCAQLSHNRPPAGFASPPAPCDRGRSKRCVLASRWAPPTLLT